MTARDSEMEPPWTEAVYLLARDAQRWVLALRAVSQGTVSEVDYGGEMPVPLYPAEGFPAQESGEPAGHAATCCSDAAPRRVASSAPPAVTPQALDSCPGLLPRPTTAPLSLAGHSPPGAPPLPPPPAVSHAEAAVPCVPLLQPAAGRIFQRARAMLLSRLGRPASPRA